MLSLYVFFVFISHYRFLKNADYEISEVYNSYSNFKNTMKVLIKFYLKKLSKNYNFLTHYLALIFIKIIKIIQDIFEKVHKKLISNFLEKSIENKSYVKFFWKDLKNFKKEIDSKSDL